MGRRVCLSHTVCYTISLYYMQLTTEHISTTSYIRMSTKYKNEFTKLDSKLTQILYFLSSSSQLRFLPLVLVLNKELIGIVWRPVATVANSIFIAHSANQQAWPLPSLINYPIRLYTLTTIVILLQYILTYTYIYLPHNSNSCIQQFAYNKQV